MGAKSQGHALLLKTQKTSWTQGGKIQASLVTMNSPFADTKYEVGAEYGSCSSSWTATCSCSSVHFNTAPNPPSSATGVRATQMLYEKGFWGDRMGMSTLKQLILIPSGTGKMHSLLVGLHLDCLPLLFVSTIYK